MIEISVIIITLNEEANIRDCLESVKWANEIIVSDSGSKDKTVAICKEFTDKVFLDKWLGYGRQKNLCIERTKNDWVLNVDADERITDDLRIEIKETLKKSDFNGFYVPRKNHFLGKWIKHCGWHPDYNLRLFNKNHGRFNNRIVHESVVLNGKAAYLKGSMEHYTYKDVSSYIKRMEKYSKLSADEMLRNGRRAGYLNIFLRPMATFLRMFILQKGFLEGSRGLILSGLYSSYTLAKYAKLWEMQNKDHKR